VRHSTHRRDRVVAANINFELGNIWGPTRNVVVHGKGKTTLDGFLEAAAADQNRRVEEVPNPRAGWYYRSDQFSFARAGIPALWFESGRDFVDRPPGWGDGAVDGWIGSHYHQPSNEVTDAWRFDGMGPRRAPDLRRRPRRRQRAGDALLDPRRRIRAASRTRAARIDERT
jgi:Zn-dependent M28 family amino/carboxypeptidase